MKNRMTVRVFALRFPELFQFLLDKLSEHCQKSDSLVLHPILMILTRLYPSQKEEYNDQVSENINDFIGTLMYYSQYDSRNFMFK